MPLPERVPPQNIEAEQAVLGAMLIKKEAIVEVQEILQPEDFYRETHRLVYEAMIELSGNDEPVDLVTLTEQLRKSGMLEKIGGLPFLTQLANAVPTAANVTYHAKIVKEKAELRRLISAATEIAGAAYEDADSVENIMDAAEKKILSVAGGQNGGDFESMKSIVMRTFERLNVLYESKGGLTGLSCGFKDLDKLTSGLQKSDLILVAARPSMGKTAFTLNIASYVGLHGGKVAFFSLEMSKEQLMQGRPSRNGDNRQQEISEISRSLKALARELDVPVIALSQLSRSVESRQVKKPMLSDLRESGSLEQDADIVMFLYREDYYDKDTENKNITEIIIAKHRNGPVDSIQLFFQKEYTKFRDLLVQ